MPFAGCNLVQPNAQERKERKRKKRTLAQLSLIRAKKCKANLPLCLHVLPSMLKESCSSIISNDSFVSITAFSDLLRPLLILQMCTCMAVWCRQYRYYQTVPLTKKASVLPHKASVKPHASTHLNHTNQAGNKTDVHSTCIPNKCTCIPTKHMRPLITTTAARDKHTSNCNACSCS